MTPIRRYKFYDLGAKLHRVCANKSAVGATEMFVPLMEAQTALDSLIKGDPLPLDIAKTEANNLLNKLGALFDKYFIDPNTRQFRFPGREEVIDAHELNLLRALVEKFETSFAAELSRRAVYTVPKRGLFDTYELTEHADTQFSEETLRAMPASVRDDVRTAGRALAFGLSTACCFHLIRAIDTLKNRNSYVPDARAQAMLADMDTRIRPLLEHAQSTISIDDATIFFTSCGSLVSLMLHTAPSTNRQRIKQAEDKLDEARQIAEADEAETAPRSKSA